MLTHLQAVDHPYLVVHSATAPGQAAGAAAEAGRKAAEASRAEAQEVAEQVAASGKLPTCFSPTMASGFSRLSDVHTPVLKILPGLKPLI